MPDENPDIIVVDDDPMVGTLSRDLLTDEGYNVLLFNDSIQAISAIKEKKPRLVVMDIMMPGLDGMELCRRIKSDPLLKGTRVILVSGKSFQVEKHRAFKLGADTFIQKPYNVETFSKTVKQLLEGGSPPPPLTQETPPPSAPMAAREETPEPPDLDPGVIRVITWGCRALPAMMPNSVSRHGRQTSCVSVETGDHLFILDGGTGIVGLGREIVRKKRPKTIWIILTHFHLDHILGLGEFEPLLLPGYTINIVGTNDPDKNLRDMVQGIFYGSFAWLKTPPSARLELFEVLEDTYELVPGIKLLTMYSNHPTTTLCLGLELGGKKIIYAPDSEIFGETTSMQDYDEKFAWFCRDADLFIHDANYDGKEYELHKNEGHSSVTNVLEFAAEKARVKELVLFHLNASSGDEELEAMH
ncbi:MAG: response regulator, partial [bacterium]